MAASSKKNAAPQTAPVAAAEPLPEVLNPAEVAAEVAEAVAEPVAAIQQSVRAAFEKGVAESRAAFVKAKVSADDVASSFPPTLATAIGAPVGSFRPARR